MAGVTSASDLGAPLEASINVARRIASGEIPGPNLYVSGPFIQHAPYPGHRALSLGRQRTRGRARQGEEDRRCRRRCDQADRSGSDDGDEVSAVVDEAHKPAKPGHRARVTGPTRFASVSSRRRLLRAHRAGDRAGISRRHSLIQERTREDGARAAVLDADHRGLASTIEYQVANPMHIDDPAWQLDAARRHRRRHHGRAEAHRPPRLLTSSLAAAAATSPPSSRSSRGRPVLLIGTDSGIPMNFHSHSDLARAGRLGQRARRRSDDRDPRRDLLAAGRDESRRKVGTVSAGKYADIIAVSGDVLRYISLLQRVDIVFKHGVRYK